MVDVAAPVYHPHSEVSDGSGFAICSGVQSHHQGWPVDAILAQTSVYKIVAMGSSIWWRSQVSIIVPFDTPTADHFSLLALSLRIRVASACSVALDRIQIASIRFSAESGVQRHRALELDGLWRRKAMCTQTGWNVLYYKKSISI